MFGRTPSSRLRVSFGQLLAIGLVSSLLLQSGCSLWRGDKSDLESEARLKELMRVPDAPDLIREAAVPRGLNPISVEGVGVVNALPGTGGPADPSALRDQLLEEMKHNDVANPNEILELEDTAMVRVRALIPPGARRGDPLDLQILTPKRSRVSDLHGGWLLDTRMRHMQVMNQSVRKSDVMAMGTGALITRTDHEASRDEALRTEGRILGGGRVQTDRDLGLILRPEYQHVKMASQITDAINNRFYFYDGTTRRGIAKAIEDDFIQVEVHPRYRDNEFRLMSVILAIAGKPNSQTHERLADLSNRLADPTTAADAALQLEAIGDEAVPTLIGGMQSSNPELRFYAAEALAYLDRAEPIEVLEQAARDVPAFRHSALRALQGIPKAAAIDALQRLFAQPSLETRYGAFVAVRDRSDGRRRLTGQRLGDSLKLYRVQSAAPAAVVVSLRDTPEVVLFGDLGPIQMKQFLLGQSGLILKPEPSNQNKIRISRFRPQEDDRRVIVDNNVADVIKGIVAVGGGYGDVIQVLRTAKEKDFLGDQLAIDPLPKALRTYYRDEEKDE